MLNELVAAEKTPSLNWMSKSNSYTPDNCSANTTFVGSKGEVATSSSFEALIAALMSVPKDPLLNVPPFVGRSPCR